MRLMKVGIVAILAVTVSWAKFDPCRFNFGFKDGAVTINEADIIAQYTWAGASMTDDIRSMLNKCKSGNKTPALYMYIIAKSSGLGDCNTGGGLCEQGANYIRNNRDKIKGYYRDYASAIKSAFGTSDPVICIMEPDYYQYTYSSQQGGGLSFQDAGTLMGELVDIVKEQLPNALLSMDISPWIEDQGATNNWLNALPISKVNYMSTSGGISQAGNSLIKSDNKLTWKKVYDITKKCIIADCGYGAGGVGTGHDANWDNVSNINNRINDGVLAIIQFSPKQDWGNTIKSISGQLSKPICPCSGIIKTTYTLTVTATSGGKVTRSPDATSYDSGTVVTLTAVPNSGYRFKSWGGDVTGTSTTATVTMTADKNVTATFVDVNAKPSYSLTVTTTGSGVVTVTPNQAEFDSGTAVTLEAFVVDNAAFTGWGGALSGTAPQATLIMNGNKTVTAAFTGNTISLTNLVKNGDFSDGTAHWTFGAYNSARGAGAAVDGGYAITIETAGTEAWHIQLYQGGISLKQNEKYELSFTASSQSNTSINVNIGMGAEPYTSYSQEKTVDLTPAKTRHAIAFTMKAASTADARLEFNCGKAASGLRIDDISLTVAVELGAYAPAPFFGTREAVGIAADRRVSLSWYDHAGRLLQHAAGEYGSLLRHNAIRRPGSYIAVIALDGRKLVKRTVIIGKEGRFQD
ncbi:MAG: carbohydrate binding domain-containing protein [Chitinispirillaceae bacterium]|nr:carbohydrate binding domain-containing protein [Chitinispirillaceae bacterium]